MKPENTPFDLLTSLPSGNSIGITITLPPTGLSLVFIKNNLNPFIMRTKLLKAFFAFLLINSFGNVHAQSDLIAMNTVSGKSSTVDLYSSNEKILISDFKRAIGSEEVASVISVKAEDPIMMNVRVFNTAGDLAKEEIHSLQSGLTDLNVDLSNLSQGVYMIQFYTKDGSALRRFIKYN